MFKLITPIAAAIFVAGAADAIPLYGTFSIDIYQRLNATGAEAQATEANLAAADTTYLETITYTGELWFKTSDLTDATTISQWLDTGGGAYTLSAATGNLQLSKPFYGNGTATATFFNIVGTFTTPFDAVIAHDDGISVFDDGTELASVLGPTSEVSTAVDGFDGGVFRIIYVATNGDPSVLQVFADSITTEPVPLPAGLPMLLSGIAGLAFLRRRRG